MTPEAAIEFLDKVVSQVSMNRTDHTQVQVAVSVLKAALTAKREEADE